MSSIILSCNHSCCKTKITDIRIRKTKEKVQYTKVNLKHQIKDFTHSMWQKIILLSNKNQQPSTEAGGTHLSASNSRQRYNTNQARRRSKSHILLERSRKDIWAWNLVLIQSRDLLPLKELQQNPSAQDHPELQSRD